MHNISINNVAVKPREIKMEIKVVSKTNRANKPWVGADNEILTALIESGKHPVEVAPMIGRTESAVRQQMCNLGLRLGDVKSKMHRQKVAEEAARAKAAQIAKDKAAEKAAKKATDQNNNYQVPVNMAQMGLLFSQMDDMYDRSRNVSRDVNDMKSFLVDTHNKAEIVRQDLEKTQQSIKAHIATSVALNVITLTVLAWITLS